jgi:cytochrome c-type biogenesis protein CcmH
MACCLSVTVSVSNKLATRTPTNSDITLGPCDNPACEPQKLPLYHHKKEVIEPAMVLILTFGVILACVTTALCVVPLRAQAFKPKNPVSGVYHRQLKELDQDINAGRVLAGEAAALRTEIARRLLAEDSLSQPPKTQQANPWVPLVFALLVPAIAVPSYYLRGTPGQPDMPQAIRLANAEANQDMDAMVAKVERRLVDKPDDGKGWALLAPIYMQLARYREAAEAYQQLLRLEAPSPELYAAFGEALTFANEGIVPDVAEKAFTLALQLDPDHAKASFYAAVVLKQDGKTGAAREAFDRLLRRAGPDAPWRTDVEREIASLAKPPALTSEQVKQSTEMSVTDRQDMIRNMVAGLEARLDVDSNDIGGWLKLIRARAVMGEQNQARSSLAKARTAFKDNPQERAALDALAAELELQ